MTDINDEARFRVGTLVYNRASLIVLFSWMLWGSFVLAMMEIVMPSLLPIVLRDNGASNKAIGFIVSSLYMIINTIANPIISYKSDRYRSRWGRRRPFILATTPFVVLLLALIPFAPEISRALENVGWLAKLLQNSPITTLVLVSGILVATFQIFNMFIASINYYLVVDVVPEVFIGRYASLSQIFGASAGFVFNYFIFGMAKMYMQEIFIGIALIYGVFITIMCLNVKEGEYPALDKTEKNDHWWRSILNYGVECFGRPFYWLVFFVYSLFVWANVSNVFNIFLFRDQMGLTLGHVGKLNAYAGVVSLIAIYPFGIMIDRWGSHKSLITGMIGFCVIRVASFFLVTDYWSLLVAYILWNVFWYLVVLSFFKWTVNLYPRKRYGQFASAGAMIASVGGAVLGPLCGLFLDWVHDYRYVLLWPVAFQLFGMLGALIIYRRWKAMGGEAGYQTQCDNTL